jgi:hypothetical protein
MDTLSIWFTSENDDGTHSVQGTDVTDTYFVWTDVTDVFLRTLMAQGYVISKQMFIKHIEGQDAIFNWPDEEDEEEEEENAH